MSELAKKINQIINDDCYLFLHGTEQLNASGIFDNGLHLDGNRHLNNMAVLIDTDDENAADIVENYRWVEPRISIDLPQGSIVIQIPKSENEKKLIKDLKPADLVKYEEVKKKPINLSPEEAEAEIKRLEAEIAIIEASKRGMLSNAFESTKNSPYVKLRELLSPRDIRYIPTKYIRGFIAKDLFIDNPNFDYSLLGTSQLSDSGASLL